jgi:hypothetical protein
MKRIFPFLCVTFFVTAFSNNIKSHYNQGLNARALEENLHQPDYASNTLANDFSDLIALLENGKNSANPKTYITSVFKIFGNLTKATPYINSYVFNDFLDELPGLLYQYCTPQRAITIAGHKKNKTDLVTLPMLDRLHSSFSILLYDNFIDGYVSGAFKQDPQQFLQHLIGNVYHVTQEEISIESLRKNCVRFLELAIDRLIWSPKDPMRCWQSVKATAEKITLLYEYNIINDIDDLDTLYLSLVYRFGFYLDLSSQDIPLAFYSHLKKELAQNNMPFLDLDEQTTFLETKRAYLTRTIMTLEAHARANAIFLP